MAWALAHPYLTFVLVIGALEVVLRIGGGLVEGRKGRHGD